MSANGPTGAPPMDGVQAALDDISQAVYKAAWRIRQHQAHEYGPTFSGPTGPSGGHPWRAVRRKSG